jgi:hypothetical protein
VTEEVRSIIAIDGGANHRKQKFIASQVREGRYRSREAAQRFEGGDVHVSLRQVAEHTRHNVEIFTELSINVDQIDPDDWPTFSKKIQELRPRLYRTVRIPAVTNLDAPEKPADTK